MLSFGRIAIICLMSGLSNFVMADCKPLISIDGLNPSGSTKIIVNKNEFCFENAPFSNVVVGNTKQWKVTTERDISLPFSKKYTKLTAIKEDATTDIILYGVEGDIYTIRLIKNIGS